MNIRFLSILALIVLWAALLSISCSDNKLVSSDLNGRSKLWGTWEGISIARWHTQLIDTAQYITRSTEIRFEFQESTFRYFGWGTSEAGRGKYLLWGNKLILYDVGGICVLFPPINLDGEFEIATDNNKILLTQSRVETNRVTGEVHTTTKIICLTREQR